MSDENKESKTGAADSGTDASKNDGGTTDAGTTGQKSDGVDFADALEKALERAEKAEKDRDNYRTGMLAAKGKNQAGAEGETDDERIARLVLEKLAEDQRTNSDSEIKKLVPQILRRNKELETAMQAKQAAGTTAAGGGSTDTTPKPSDNMLSDAQMTALKARGWDDKKISRFKENLAKAR
jgi:hypothetical protein